MTKEEIVKQVKDIIVDKLGVEESAVTESASFTNDLGADSLDTVELLMEFERVFGIKIPDEETSGIATVGDAITKVHPIKHKRGQLKSWPLFLSYVICISSWELRR